MLTVPSQTLRMSVQVCWLHDPEVSDTLLKELICDHTD